MSTAVLVSHRSTHGKVITRIAKWSKSVSATTTNRGTAVAQLELLDSTWSKFMECQLAIEEVCGESELSIQQDHVAIIEPVYIDTKGIILTLLDSLTIQSPPPPAQVPATPSSEIKLPRQELPKFTGDPLSRNSFRDLFTKTIHFHPALSGAQKLQHLKNCLCGNAALILRSYQATDANYVEAWEVLKNRYDNERLIVNEYIKVMFNAQSLRKEASTNLRTLIDSFRDSLRALKALSQPIEHWDTFVSYLLVSKLDQETHRQWELSLKDNNVPKLSVLFEFLECRCRSLEAVSTTISKNSNVEIKQKPILTFTCASDSCVKCKASHPLHLCDEFLRLNVQDRFDYVKRQALCINCLKSGHRVGSCRIHGCRTCQKKHHTTLHFPRHSAVVHNNSPNNVNQLSSSTNASNTYRLYQSNKPIDSTTNFTRRPFAINNNSFNSTDQSSSSTSGSNSQPNQLIAPTANLGVISLHQRPILLSTAIVAIKLSNGVSQQIRALIDPGSTATFISEQCVQRLGFNRKAAKIPIFGIGESSPGYSQGITTVTIQSRYDSSSKITLSALILTKVTKQLPRLDISTNTSLSLCGLDLADTRYFEDDPIDLLIGADYYGEILLDGVIKGVNGVPTAQRTIFGWILSGPVDIATSYISARYTTTIAHHVHVDLDVQLRKFWEIESINPKSVNSTEENICEANFVKNFHRDVNGRFIVQLPFKNSSEKLGNSRNSAEKSFLLLEKRFKFNPVLHQNYSKFINEYIKLDHMEPVMSSSLESQSYYLPHHPVFKESSSTTKLRVVFDASRKTSTNVSLNDLLLVGPKIQDDLTAILTRFRSHRIVFVCDISKMYRQFWLIDEHQDFQRILWREKPEHPLREFRLKTVTYGTASASYLATRCLKQISIDFQDKYQQAAKIISSDFYVDDLMTGSDTVLKSLQLQGEIILILKQYGIELRKWASNSSNVLHAVPEEHRENLIHQEMDPSGSIKTLGLLWYPLADHFGFNVRVSLGQNQFTKRQVLSEISKIFDPLGLVSPTVLLAKLLMQKLWAERIDWDQSLPNDLLNEWLQFCADLSNLEKIKIPRWIGTVAGEFVELHGFCDASELAYSSVIYSRTICADGTISTQIISSKTRVAPIRQITLARLELCAAVLLSKQLCDVVAALKLNEANYFLWSDSSIVLAWLRKLPRTWSTFVANRVAEVQELTCIERWRHVPSSENPADIALRGVLPSKLLNIALWWSGPSWLLESEDHWPRFSQNLKTHLEERKKLIIALTATIDERNTLLETFSTLSKLKVVTAYLFRFLHNCKAKKNNAKCHVGTTTTEERKDALLFWIKFVQGVTFHEEIKYIAAGSNVHGKSKILSLNPFLDEDGVLRVGGRLHFSNLAFQAKHQIILPPKSIITNLIIKDIHERNLHSGGLLTLATLRQQFWICGGRKEINYYIHRCVRCFRFKKNNRVQPLMGELPAARVNLSYPFEITGVDFASPVTMRYSSRHRKITTKGYICVFVCLTTKAVHLELVSDLTSSAFLASFRRFVGRRGIPRELQSDCGTNFVGASRELRELYRKMKQQFDDPILLNLLGDMGTNWKFIPPGSPHFGGLWESAVKSTKSHLIRVIGKTILSYEELTTVLCQTEACLNSRPLCPLTEDILDHSVLTPGHFLIGRPVNSIPDPNLSHIKINRLSRWQLVQKIVQEFWKCWHLEYLNSLQQRPKWKMATKNLEIGDLALIKDERLPPAKWLLGRIIHLHPGRDNIVRVVSIKTSGGVLKRPSNKLCILPIDTK